MRLAYPTIFTPIEDEYFLVTVPDFPFNTEGKDISDALFMAHDAIGLMCIAMQDDNQELPKPSRIQDIAHEPDDIVSLVNVDVDEYRKMHSKKVVRRNISLPLWLNSAAEHAGLNVSAITQAALKRELNISSESV